MQSSTGQYPGAPAAIFEKTAQSMPLFPASDDNDDDDHMHRCHDDDDDDEEDDDCDDDDDDCVKGGGDPAPACSLAPPQVPVY